MYEHIQGGPKTLDHSIKFFISTFAFIVFQFSIMDYIHVPNVMLYYLWSSDISMTSFVLIMS